MTDTIVDKLLLQAIESNKIKIARYEVQITDLTNIIALLMKENTEYTVEYQKACKHLDTVVGQTHHLEGGYDYVSETQFINKCTRCNKVLGRKLVRGGHA